MTNKDKNLQTLNSLQVPQNITQQSNKETKDCIINLNNENGTTVILDNTKDISNNIVKADVNNDYSVSETSCSAPYKDIIIQEYKEEETFM